MSIAGLFIGLGLWAGLYSLGFGIQQGLRVIARALLLSRTEKPIRDIES